VVHLERGAAAIGIERFQRLGDAGSHAEAPDLSFVRQQWKLCDEHFVGKFQE
jgi:hypothetical protein